MSSYITQLIMENPDDAYDKISKEPRNWVLPSISITVVVLALLHPWSREAISALAGFLSEKTDIPIGWPYLLIVTALWALIWYATYYLIHHDGGKDED